MRTGFAVLLTLTLVTTLLVAQSAEAQTLSARKAESLAKRLLNKQLKSNRNLVEARISARERVSSRTIRYLYDDLSRNGVVCVGVIQVRRTGNTFRATFTSTHCERPGTEGLAFRAAARAAGTEFVRRERSLVRSLTRFTDSAQPCETLDVPNDRVDEATLLLSAGLTQATVRPLRSMLEDYASTLQSLGVTDAQLGKGAAAWRDFVSGAGTLPHFQQGYCAVLAEWAANGFTDETAPVDFAALQALTDRLQADGAEVRRTARYMARVLGIDPVTANAFSLNNLIGNTVQASATPAAAAKQLARRIAG